MARGRGRSGHGRLDPFAYIEHPTSGRNTIGGGRGRGGRRGRGGAGAPAGGGRGRHGAGLEPQAGAFGRGARGRGQGSAAAPAGGRGAAAAGAGRGGGRSGGGRFGEAARADSGRGAPRTPAAPSPYNRTGIGGTAGRGAGGISGGRNAQAGGDHLALYGLANQYLFVELEKDGVWKVSVPHGQRFGWSFLAGLEVWASQVVAGKAPILQRSLAAHMNTPGVAATTPGLAATTPGGGGAAAAATPTPRIPNFIPPPPPPQCAAAVGSVAVQQADAAAARGSSGGGGDGAAGRNAHPITSLTGSGLPGLDTLGVVGPEATADKTSVRHVAAAPPSLFVPPPSPPPPPVAAAAAPIALTAAGGVQRSEAACGAASALDFVSMLQAQMGIESRPQAPVVAVTAAAAAARAGASLAEDKFTSIARVDEPATPYDTGADVGAGEQEQEQGRDEEAGPAQEQEEGERREDEQGQQERGPAAPRQTAPSAPVGAEYQGLMASLAEAEAEAPYQPYDLEDLEAEHGEPDGEEGAEEAEGAALEEEEEEEEGELYEEANSMDEEDEGAYESEGDFEGFDDYEEEDEDEAYDDDSDVDSMTDYGEYDKHVEELEDGTTVPRRAPVASAGAAASASAAAVHMPQIPPPPPPLPRAPLAGVAAMAAATAASSPLSIDLLRQLRSLDDKGRLRVSLRLERQALNDVEVELLADWYQERAAQLLEVSKIWLYDNCIGDCGATAVARALLHPALLELHLSHNVIGDEGAAALVRLLPSQRPVGLRPLWLRLEWNIINVELLQRRLEEERRSRGLTVDVPRVEPSGKSSAAASSPPNPHDHDLHLVLTRGVTAAVRLPWVACQKQPPREANVLRAVKGFYTAAGEGAVGAGGGGAGASARAEPSAPPPPSAFPASPAPATTPTAPPTKPSLPPPPPPPTQPPPPPPTATAPTTTTTTAAAAAAAAATAAGAAEAASASASAAVAAAVAAAAAEDMGPGGGGAATYAPGPLLLFPDTSALLSMLGCNTSLLGAAGRPPLDWSLLIEMAARGRFGRCLPLHDQVFIVVADSVMKQLDGLKSTGMVEIITAVRRFMSQGLEQAGPAGYDFLTVLGAHEGEGLALGGEAGGPMGLAGSRSPWLTSKGQAVDLRIVEVALFYQADVTRAYQQSAGPPSTGGGGPAGGGGGAGSAPAFLPVMLLSNDNAQISAAKCHGLPAFRLSTAGDLTTQLAAVAAGGGALTSGVFRRLLAPQATLALGTAPTRSLQDQFDSAVATLRAVVEALGGSLLPQLERLLKVAARGSEPADASPEPGGVEAQAAAEPSGLGDPAAAEGQNPEEDLSGGAAAALREIRAVLEGSDSGGAGDAATGGDSGGGGGAGQGLVSGLRELLGGLRAELVGWEGVVRSRKAPSRLVQWAALGGGVPSGGFNGGA